MKMRGGPFLNESNKFPNKCASPNKHKLNNRVIQKGQKFQMVEIPISHPRFLLFR